MVHVSDRIPKISTNLPDVLFSWVSCIFPSIDNYLFFFFKKKKQLLFDMSTQEGGGASRCRMVNPSKRIISINCYKQFLEAQPLRSGHWGLDSLKVVNYPFNFCIMSFYQ
jgi:hypothetical protein